MQGAVKRLTDINSALRTVQACMILLYLWQLSTLASAIPYFKLFSGVFLNPLVLLPAIIVACPALFSLSNGDSSGNGS
jgi:hypothetical protein